MLRLLLLAVSLWLTTGAARVLIARWLDACGVPPERTAPLLGLSAAYPQLAARRALVAGDVPTARTALRESLALFPFSASAWLDLAETLLRAGDEQGTSSAAANAGQLAPTSASVRWRAAQLRLRAGDVDNGLRELKVVAVLDPQRRARVYDLGWALLGDANAVESRLVADDPAQRLAYIEYLMASGRIAAGRDVWAAVRASAARAWRLDFIDFLLSHHQIGWAWEVWTETVPGIRDGAIFNGDFAYPPLNRGFDWRLGGVEGASAEIVTAAARDGPVPGRVPSGERRALRVSFRGDANPTFDRANQIVHVEGGRRYRLAASVRWENITSASPPFLEVRGYLGCESLVARSAGFARSGAVATAVEFTTPTACEAVLVGVRRDATVRLDRTIGGTLWIDDVALLPGTT